jgi:protein-S-isoprenylcysteine O-methyltransferase Ste14
MNIKLILIIMFSILYGFFEIFMSLRQNENRKISESGDKGSIWILILSISMGYWLSFIMGATTIGRLHHWNTFFIIGSVVASTGFIIRVTSILKLRKQFTYTVTKIENHELIETGLFKIIRHPGYLGQLIIFLGISVCLSNWLSVLLMMLPVMSGYIYRINVEERFMAEHLGQKYLDYRKRTKRLIPVLY